jgi:hypothetical protein
MFTTLSNIKLIQSITIVRNINNIVFRQVKPKELNVKKHIEELITQHKESKRKFRIRREFEGIVYNIVISYKYQNTNGIMLELYKDSDIAEVLYDYFITFEKLKSLCTKLRIENTLPSLADLSIITTLDQFIEKIFIYFTLISASKGKPTVNIVSRPIGICNSIYEFSFLKTKCIVDFLVLQSEVYFYIYQAESESKYLKVMLDLDESSFNSMVFELRSISSEDADTSYIKNYRLSDQKHLNKNGFIPYIIVKLQDMFRVKLKNENLTFDELLAQESMIKLKLRIENELSLYSLWLLTQMNESLLVDYYTLNRVTGRILL